MPLSEQDIAFLHEPRAAGMVTLAKDGTPKIARVAVALVDGQVWSSGTRERIRTARLRRDPRCTLFVFDAGVNWMALEATVDILDDDQSPARNLKLFRVMQDKPTGPLTWNDGELDEEAFLQAMVDEGRLVYQFDVHRSYGAH